MKSIDLIAPAKVNLYLGIGPRRQDGYHDATTVMHALALHDKIHMTLLSAGERTTLFEPCDTAQPLRQFEAAVEAGSGLVVSSNNIWCEGIAGTPIPDEANLACRAVVKLAQALGRSEDELIRMTIEKHIPSQTGLGGGSADAAAALVGAADLWDVPADDPALLRVAKQLGADVVFFLYGGCVALKNRGDELSHRLMPRHDSMVIIRPDSGVSTKLAYETFDQDPTFPSQAELDSVLSCTSADEVHLGNNLTAPACKILPELADVRAFAQASEGVTETLLCGSGSGTLALCQNFSAAQALSSAAQQQGWWARTTSFSSVRAAKLPEKK